MRFAGDIRPVLKGHSFSGAVNIPKIIAALAAEVKVGNLIRGSLADTNRGQICAGLRWLQPPALPMLYGAK